MDGRRVLEAAAASAADGSVGGLGARAARGAETHAEAGAVEDIRRVGARRAAAAVVRAQERLCKQHTYDVYIHEYLACETVYVCTQYIYVRSVGCMHIPGVATSRPSRRRRTTRPVAAADDLFLCGSAMDISIDVVSAIDDGRRLPS